MGMFYTPSPRRFNYKPRFYSEEKEELEMLEAKYAKQKNATSETTDEDVRYYRDLVDSFDKKEEKNSFFSFLKRKQVRQFSYKPRFSDNGEPLAEKQDEASKGYGRKIELKKAMHERHSSYTAEPVPASRIFIYAAIVSIIVLWILFGNFERVVEVFTTFGAGK
ncbi:MAG: hypothetical protein J5605_06820 [Bacteroidales bacterium]|nr:hypothetical protein [Bacteroidales bacterium]